MTTWCRSGSRVAAKQEGTTSVAPAEFTAPPLVTQPTATSYHTSASRQSKLMYL